MKKIKVFYDYQMLLFQKYGGISRYFYELVTSMKNSKRVIPKMFVPLYQSVYFEKYFFHKPMSSFWKKHLSICNKIDKFVSILKLRLGKYDIVHPTYYDPYVLKIRQTKMIVTVYDMIHEIYPQYFNNDGTAQDKKEMIFAADHIIAISQSTKKDILKIYPEINEEKISVIYIASNFVKVKDNTVASKFPNKYILFVGNRTGYKNYDLFFEAVQPILEADKDLSLVCLGGGKFTQSEIEKQGELSERIIQMDVNDAILSYGYSNAICFVFPSLYEGFGIPTLEAFACDCPVILSNTSSMPEVGGDAVVYIDPKDKNDIGEKIKKVIEDEELRKSLIEKGRRQLLKFDWNEIANETQKCYEEVLREYKR